MKVEMLIEHYTNGKITLVGKGIKEVEDSFGEYLIKTFPSWFKKVEEDKDLNKKMETKEKKLRKKAKRK